MTVFPRLVLAVSFVPIEKRVVKNYRQYIQMQKNRNTFSENVRHVVRSIPRGVTMTYKEVADKMHLSPRTVDGYRDALFQKLGIKTRTGLVIYAIKHNIVQV